MAGMRTVCPRLALAATLLFVGATIGQAQETLTFEQLDWYGLYNSSSTPDIPDSSWGRVTIDYTEAPMIQYFNLNIDGYWVIQNASIPPRATPGTMQTLTMKFDLHVPDGTDVSLVNYGYYLGLYPQAASPDIQDQGAVLSCDYQIGGDDDIDLTVDVPIHASDKVAVAHPPLAVGVIPDIGSFVNQPQGKNECAPGAISNSLKYLEATGKISGIPNDISDVKPWIGWDSDGAPADWPQRKETELENRIGQTVNVRTIEGPLTLAKCLDLIAELEDGQDIEMDLRGHVEVLLGLRINDDGTVDLLLADDNQKDTKEDPLHVSSLMTDGSVDIVDGMELERFVVECPGPTIDVFDALVEDGLVTGGGTGYEGGTWYYYDLYGWYNQWFYDHPYSSSHLKNIDLHLDVVNGDPSASPKLEVVINWAIPGLWPPGEPTPPLPGMYPPEDEDFVIARELVYVNQGWNEVIDIPFTIANYNPEWISIDIRDLNADGLLSVTGQICHSCVPKPYSLTVNSGDGSGDYAEGKMTVVAADPPPAGYIFNAWTGNVEILSHAGFPTTLATMPAYDCQITATYQQELADLVVNDGTGGGVYPVGTLVDIEAYPPPQYHTFDQWIGDTAALDNQYSSPTTATVPSDGAEVTATYRQTHFLLEVNSGSGGGMYPPATIVDIVADPAAVDSFFDVWVGDTDPLAYPPAAVTEVTMPYSDVIVTATYTTDPVRCDQFTATLSDGVLIAGGGSGYGDGEWYEYPLYEWWNQWYYDHPLDNTRSKVVNLHLDVISANGGMLEVAINWATPEWLPGNPAPPLPGYYPAGDEDLIIGRDIVYVNPGQPEAVDIRWVWPDYNPEWISIDIRDVSGTGYFDIAGEICHECTPKAYMLTVHSGSGSGLYPLGTPVTIVADVPPPDSFFDVWIGNTEILGDPGGSTTIATIPAYDTEVTATYRPNEYLLTVNSGSGGGMYLPASVVSIVADPVPPDSFFDVWVGDTMFLDYPPSPVTTVTMPSSPVTVTATYTTNPVRCDSFSVVLSDNVVTEGGGTGYGGGQWYYYPLYEWWNQWYYDHPFDWDRGKRVDLHLEVVAAQPGGMLEVAINWATTNWPPSSPVPPLPGTFLPEDEDLMIGRDIVYNNDGHPDIVDIEWALPDYNPEWISIDIRDISGVGYFSIVGDICHECAPKYLLTVNTGSGDGLYLAGTVVAISADTVAGSCFDDWEGDIAYVTDVDNPNTTVTMPPHNVTVTATYNLLPDKGDLNNDGFVGQADLDIVLDAWGDSVPPGDVRADPSGDGFVGQADLDIVLDNWGEGCTP